MAVSRLVEVLPVDTKNKCELEMVESLISNASVQLHSLNVHAELLQVFPFS